MRWKSFAAAGLGLVVATQSAAAQAALRRFDARPAGPLAVQTSGPTTGFSAFAREALGATAGSALGFGVVYLSTHDDCAVEDDVCNLQHAAGAMAVGTVGAALGGYLTGKLFDTRPSGIGALLGSVAGAAAGLGTWHLFTEELDIVNKSTAATASYVITQGIVTALGSRIGSALK